MGDGIADGIWMVLGLIVAVVVFIFAAVVVKFFRLWLRAMLSGASVGFLSLLGMSLRKVNPSVIVGQAGLWAVKAGLRVTTNELETHYLAGGNVVRVVQALIAANKANIQLNFQQATAIDLAGRDVLDAVQTSGAPEGD